MPIPSTRSRVRGLLVAACVLLGSLTCATAARAVSQGERALLHRDSRSAVPVLAAEATRRPGSMQAQRAYGIALYRSGDAAGAVRSLSAARRLAPRDRPTLYFLGNAAEAAGDTTLALDAYRTCLALGGATLGPVRARVDVLVTAGLRAEARRRIAEERSIPVASVPENTVAVPEFAFAGGPDSLRPVCLGLASVLVNDLGKVPQLRIVERNHIDILLDELKLASSSPGQRAVDPKTAPRYGRLLGARRFAQGSVLAIDDARMQLRGSVIDTKTASVRGTGVPVDGRMDDVIQLEKHLVYEVLDTLGIHPDAALRRAIGVPATRSFPAFLAFSRGLEFEALGRTAEAATAYREALRLDPHFSLAQDRADVTGDTPAMHDALEQNMLESAAGTGDGGDAEVRSTDALGMGPPSDGVPNAGLPARVDAPTRIGAGGRPQLPGFPGVPPGADRRR